MAIIALFKRNGKAKKFGMGIIISFVIFMIGAVFSPDPKTDNKVATNSKPVISKDVKKTENVKKEKDLGILKVHYINVGQADSILIQQNGHNMLIDAVICRYTI